jgi:glycosyltransferase involved in cell wall biosynthesis
MAGQILCWGTYDTSKPRSRILRDGLKAVGVTLTECHAPIWEHIQDKSQFAGVARRVGLMLRWMASYPLLLWRFLRMPRPDLVLVSYPGVLDVIVLWPLARLRRVPIVWDMFISLYDTVVQDRALLRRNSLAGRLLHAVEGCAIRLADLVFLDTAAHARHVERIYGLEERRCGSVWVGVEPIFFEAAPLRNVSVARQSGPLKVLFYGQFIPLHGISTIIAAARATREEQIEWRLVGRGQEAPRIRAMLAETPLPLLHWIEWLEYPQLRQALDWADVCLGIFGTSEKAACVIPNKVFQIVAAGRPLITRDSPAIRELLAPAPPCVRLIEAGNAQALADALCEQLHSRQPPVASCHRGAVERFAPSAIGQQCLDMLQGAGLRWKTP